MRIALWHGWLLEGSGSNVATARIAEVLRASGHDVLLVCQEAHPDRYPWIDASGDVDANGPFDLSPNAAEAAPGRCVLLRPRIGRLLPVFVVDEYEGFDDVKRFVDLTDAELNEYLDRNVEALRAAATWHHSDVVIAGHAIPGPVVAKRALGPQRYVAKIHGSDLEYAIRPDHRYRTLAMEGLGAARAVAGASADVLDRCVELVPGIEHLVGIVPPGVAADFRPRPRAEALLATAALLDADPDAANGRPNTLDAEVERALERRDATLDDLATVYDQAAPDPGAAELLRSLASLEGPLIGYIGKLIPQKGVSTLLEAAAASSDGPPVLIVGFGSQREWLHALVHALRTGDRDALRWLREAGGLPLDPGLPPRPGLRVGFTGRLDHRYAPGALAALDVLVVPSILEEAFGMVTIEGAAAGALPLVARHSALAEVATTFETEVGRPGLFSFEPGPGAARNLAERIDGLVSMASEERAELREHVAAFTTREWSWNRTASRLLEAAGAE